MTLTAIITIAAIGAETMTAFRTACEYRPDRCAAQNPTRPLRTHGRHRFRAGSEDASGVTEQARAALDATVSGAYALVQPASVAGAGHLATMQARGWDAAAVVSGSGVGADYAHATTLNTYRARVHDAGWLARAGETATAATMVEDVFEHFEGAAVHDALEEADSEPTKRSRAA